MGWKKKLQSMRLSSEERRSASQGAGRNGMNGMMVGMMAGSIAGFAALPFAPLTVPGATPPFPWLCVFFDHEVAKTTTTTTTAGMVAGGLVGLAAGATVGAVGGVKRERRYQRYAAYNLEPEANMARMGSHTNPYLIFFQILWWNVQVNHSLDHPSPQHDDRLFPGEGNVLGEQPGSSGITHQCRKRSLSYSSVRTRSNAEPSAPSEEALVQESTPPAYNQYSRRTRSLDDGEMGQQVLSEKERRRATRLLEKELAREHRLAVKEQKRQRKEARKTERLRKKSMKNHWMPDDQEKTWFDDRV